MRSVLSIVCVVALCCVSLAGDHRSKARGTQAWASACESCSTCTSATCPGGTCPAGSCSQPAITEQKEVVAAKALPSQPAEVVMPANQTSCSSGSCSTCSGGSCSAPTRFSRRGR